MKVVQSVWNQKCVWKEKKMKPISLRQELISCDYPNFSLEEKKTQTTATHLS